ncbi:hypothetical protein M9Y10_013048 [Tritrichomonas musculus]|uniref:Endoplasmic reticulum-based factor for assembly of V-ATPase n=1 Tax=Tritrichomonas musculus TaxID=1915356 RepID=A0ABR2I795_9EUKA
MEGEVYINLDENKKLTISEMRKMIEDDPTVDLKEKIKGGKLQVEWPHTKPPPTGEVRAKLIHQRMHKKQFNQFSLMEARPSKLNELSGIFTLFITIPAVAYSLNILLKWCGFTDTTALIASVIGGLASFFVELALVLITQYKTEKMQELRNRPRGLHSHTN